MNDDELGAMMSCSECFIMPDYNSIVWADLYCWKCPRQKWLLKNIGKKRSLM